MTNEEQKLRILNKLKNIVYFVLGITVLFLSGQAIFQEKEFSNGLWFILGIVIVVEAVIGIKKSLPALQKSQRRFQFLDWSLIIGGIILANVGYLAKLNWLLVLGGIIFIAACVPIKNS